MSQITRKFVYFMSGIPTSIIFVYYDYDPIDINRLCIYYNIIIS